MGKFAARLTVRLVYIGLALLINGCAGSPTLRDHALAVPSVELADTPFFAQAAYQCGPAALATVLVDSGVDVSPEVLVTQVYLPGRKGSTTPEIIAATRVHGRVPYVLRPVLADLLGELAAGNPVLVMQNLGIAALPQWHYAVVIGYDTGTDTLLLRSGTEQRLSMRRKRFEASWARAARWALVTVPPDLIPETANNRDWLRAASAFERLGQPGVAAAAYEASTRRWPEDAIAWLALANARHAVGDLDGSEAALRMALQLQPSAAAYNNLAQVLLAQGCPSAAHEALARADAADGATAVATQLAQTRSAIAASPDTNAAHCPR